MGKRLDTRKMTIEEKNAYFAERDHYSMLSAKKSMTDRKNKIKVTLPTLKCLEKAQ